MFGSMFKSLFKNPSKKTTDNKNKLQLQSKIEIISKDDIENMLTELDEVNPQNVKSNSSCKDSIVDTFELLSIADNQSECSNDVSSVDDLDETNSKVSSKEEYQQELAKAEVQNEINTLDKINSLECLFTWGIKSNKKNIITAIQNNYGEYNLDISSSEFTFERYLGNLIIGYELFHNNEPESAQMKILEIGKWLEELDKGSDEFYLSINIGLQHVMKGTFIHMLYATNLIGECKWLLDDIISFDDMNSKSKATVYAIRGGVLTEYGGNSKYFKNACDFINKACIIDPDTSYWFYIYALALTAQRRFLLTHKSNPGENEICAIQHAIMLSDGKNTHYNFHRMILDRDIAIRKYHENPNKNDKTMMEKNYQANLTIAKMVKTILGMEPKDPLLVVKCARVLMTLPIRVRDFNLGKQYLTKAIQMAPNDMAVLHAVEKSILHYKEITTKYITTKHTTDDKKYQSSKEFKGKQFKIAEELRPLVKKHKSGNDPLPNLIALLDKFEGRNKLKIMAQICSYTLLFANNLKACVEQFLVLMEKQGMMNDYLITEHFSSFGSRKFNLAELICNEIRLATNSSGTSSNDMLFYLKSLTKIMEICNLQMNDVDPFMKDNLIVDNARPKCPTADHQSEIYSSDNDSVINQSENVTTSRKTRSRKPRRFQNNGPKMFTERAESNKRRNTRSNVVKNDDKLTESHNKFHSSNANDMDQLQSKMAKFFNSYDSGFSNHKSVDMKNLRDLQTQQEIEQFTQRFYQGIASISTNQMQHNNSSVRFNMYPNQNFGNSNSSFQQSHQNPYPPSLLDIRPQINQQLPKPTRSRPNKSNHKKY